MSIDDTIFQAVLGETSEKKNFTTLREQKLGLDAMAPQARRDIKILIQGFSNDAFTRPEILKTFAKFARISRHSVLKILIANSDQANKKANSLIELSRKYTSVIKIRKLSEDYSDTNESFFIADKIGIVYQPNDSTTAGFIDFNSSTAKQKSKWFEDVFERSETDPYFGQFTL